MNDELIVRKDKRKRNFPRKSLIPFTKWYIKMYHKIYQDKKILKAIISNDFNNLDKNLKTKANNILNKIKNNLDQLDEFKIS